MVSSQCEFILWEVGKNIDEKHMAHYLSILIIIFKELHPEYFKENKIGCNREYPLEDLLGLTVWVILIIKRVVVIKHSYVGILMNLLGY